MRVFVCDDTAAHRALLRAVLADAPDVEIVGEACDGVECLSGIEKTHPDVLVLDLHMPGTDGWHVLERLDELQRDGVRVLVVSSDATAGDRVRARGAEFLRKGAPLEDLRKAVEGLAA